MAIEGDGRDRSTDLDGDLRDENRRLREENARLRRLVEKGTAAPSEPPDDGYDDPVGNRLVLDRSPDAAFDCHATPEQKIALFRSLFRGRDDVFAYRWQNASGKSGYSPSYKRGGIGPPPSSRQKDSPRPCEALTDAIIRDHLTGNRTVGIFPLLTDDRCWFVAADFDNAQWQDDASAYFRECHDRSIPAIVERSRSGNGAHVWIIFDEPIEAAVARRLGSLLLTLAMEKRHRIGLASYDRLFPNQDILPKGGFGNLIALPLQGSVRKLGNSVFVDAEFIPYRDQWKFLAEAKRMQSNSVHSLLRAHANLGDCTGVRAGVEPGDPSQPWTWPASRSLIDRPIHGELPTEIEVIRGDLLYIRKANLSTALIDRLARLAAFQNPDFYRSQAMRYSTFGKPRVIVCSEEFADHIGLPRGCLDDVRDLASRLGIKLVLRDERTLGHQISVEFSGSLYPEQQKAAETIAFHDDGVLCAPTAFGKTVIAAWLIANRRINTLILVHRSQLAEQWRERLSSFLGIPTKSIGMIGGGRARRTGDIDIAVMQSICRKGTVKDLVVEYGQVIVDECHHVSASSFESILRRVKAKCVHGLTATPSRKDGHDPIIFMQCGPLRYNARRQPSAFAFRRQRVLPIETSFYAQVANGEPTIQDLYAALAIDKERNSMIIEIVAAEAAKGRHPIVLTGRTSHVDILSEKLRDRIDRVFVMKGGMGRRQSKELSAELSAVRDGNTWAIVATGSFIGEGFDESRLDTLVLAMPISWRGTLQQYVGRLHRAHAGKGDLTVFDMVDTREPMLSRMYKRRMSAYRALGYEIDPFVMDAASTGRPVERQRALELRDAPFDGGRAQ